MNPRIILFTLAITIIAGVALAERQDTPGDEGHQDPAQDLDNLQKLLFDAQTAVAKLIAAVDVQEQRILAMQPAGSLRQPPVGWTGSRTWAGGSRWLQQSALSSSHFMPPISRRRHHCARVESPPSPCCHSPQPQHFLCNMRTCLQ